MLAEFVDSGPATRELASSRDVSACAEAPATDSLDDLQDALRGLRALAEQRVEEVAAARAEAASALSRVDAALDDFHATLEQELKNRFPVRSRFSALLTDHVRSCAARQRADIARLGEQVVRPEASVTAALQAAWALTLVMRVEVAQLARDVRL